MRGLFQTEVRSLEGLKKSVRPGNGLGRPEIRSKCVPVAEGTAGQRA
jgi:hypothetical protein